MKQKTALKSTKPIKTTKKQSKKSDFSSLSQNRESFFQAKANILDIRDGERLIVLLNLEQATAFGINLHDKVTLKRQNGESIVADVAISDTVPAGEIGIYLDILDKVKLTSNEVISVALAESSTASYDAIRKKMRGEKISYEEMYSIIKDISENKLDDTMMTYYVASSFFYPTTDEEMYLTAKAMAECGVTFKYPKGEIIADKHCIGGVPGNETTMVLIPLIASLGIKIPKNFSKSITSPAATGECVNVLMDINFDKKGIEKLVKEEDCCLVWGGSLDLAPADDKLIKVQYPLSMQSRAKVVSSIMAKKYAMGITHSLIDIPVGPTAKVTTMEEAKDWKKKFEYVGKKLWMKMSVAITKADEVIGNGVGAVLQVREVLRILQQHPERAKDLEDKVLHLASKIIQDVGLAKGKKALGLAKTQLTSGKAWQKMQSIIKAQHGDPKITSETLKLGTHTYDILATKDGQMKVINLHDVNAICRKLGCPVINEAGMYLYKKLGDKVKKWEKIATLYALDDTKLDLGIERFKERSPFEY